MTKQFLDASGRSVANIGQWLSYLGAFAWAGEASRLFPWMRNTYALSRAQGFLRAMALAATRVSWTWDVGVVAAFVLLGLLFRHVAKKAVVEEARQLADKIERLVKQHPKGFTIIYRNDLQPQVASVVAKLQAQYGKESKSLDNDDFVKLVGPTSNVTSVEQMTRIADGLHNAVARPNKPWQSRLRSAILAALAVGYVFAAVVAIMKYAPNAESFLSNLAAQYGPSLEYVVMLLPVAVLLAVSRLRWGTAILLWAVLFGIAFGTQIFLSNSWTAYGSDSFSRLGAALTHAARPGLFTLVLTSVAYTLTVYALRRFPSQSAEPAT